MAFWKRPRSKLSGVVFVAAMVVPPSLANGCGGEVPPIRMRGRAESTGTDRTPGSASRSAIPAIPASELRQVGGKIAFISERWGNRDVYLIRPADGREHRLSASRGDEYPARFAADGESLLIVETAADSARREEERLALYYTSSDRAPLPLTAYSGRVRNPSWGPGARWLVFESDADSFRDIYRLDRGSGALSRLTANREGNFEPDVSPDGRRVVFVSSRDGNAQIYLMNSDGSEERRLTAFHRDDWSPRWSPDGRRIAFLSDREGRARVFLMNADGTGQRRLTQATSGEGDIESESEFAWSPDGQKIAFVAQVGRATTVRIATVDPRTGGITGVRAVTGGGTDQSPAWSPDGRYVAFSSGGGESDVYVARADGSGVARITHARGADWLPRWTR